MPFLLLRKDDMGLFDEVRERVTVREVMERAGIQFNRNNMCRCPFHQDKTASMKAKPNDRKYFCFGCGEKGDAIDFIVKYMGLAPKEAAMWIATDFGIMYDDNMRSPPKPIRREKTPLQILEEAKSKTFRVLADYLALLRKWMKLYAPRDQDEEFHPRFVEACHNLSKTEYLLDILLFGSDEEKKDLVENMGKEVESIECRIREYTSNQRTVREDR